MSSEIDRLLESYFSYAKPLGYLEAAMTDILAQRQYESQDEPSHKVSLTKICVGLCATTLVESGRMQDLRTNMSTSGYFKSLCDIQSWEDTYCRTLQSTDAFSYTQMLLFIVIQLRAGTYVDKTKLDRSVDKLFINKVTLLIHALLLVRLSYSLVFYASTESDRGPREYMLFITLLSFYKDFVIFESGRIRDATLKSYYDILYKQVVGFYLNPERQLFVSLKTPNPIQMYLDQDYIHTIYGCVEDKFLETFKEGVPVTTKYMEDSRACLFNLDLNALSKRYNKFVREFSKSGFCRVITAPFHAVRVAVQTVQRGVQRACRFSDAVFLESFPKVTKVGGVIVGIIGFSSVVVQDILQGSFSLFVYSMRNTDLDKYVKYGANGEIEMERPTLTGMLIRVRNKDGTFDTIYKFHQLPRVALRSYGTTLYGGSGPSEELQVSDVVDMLYRGYTADELPLEMQQYLRSSQDLSSKMFGTPFTDYNLSGRSDVTQTVIASLNKDDPSAYAQLVPYGNEYHLILPEVPMVMDALMNADMKVVPSPQDEVTTGANAEIPRPFLQAIPQLRRKRKTKSKSRKRKSKSKPKKRVSKRKSKSKSKKRASKRKTTSKKLKTKSKPRKRQTKSKPRRVSHKKSKRASKH